MSKSTRPSSSVKTAASKSKKATSSKNSLRRSGAKSTRAANKKKGPRRQRSFFWRWFWRLLGIVFVAALLFGGYYVVKLDYEIKTRFTGDKWPEPSRLYARPMDLFVGAPLSSKEVVAELKRLGYTRADRVTQAGTWRQVANTVYVGKRPFKFWDGEEPYRRLEIKFNKNTISSVVDYDTKESIVLTRLDPQMIGSVYPSGGEDRILVKLDEVPEQLVQTLLAVEDRKFYDHPGIDIRGIARAVVTNISSGKMQQGGSTLTQQLVKNYFLTNARTIRRKIDEAIMAWRLEMRFSKQEILEAYLNEIFLSQDGDRAVHGFGLASYYFFGKPLQELETHQIALLVGMVKGPSAYHPIREEDAALARRAVVLKTMVQQEIISEAEEKVATLKPLGVLPKPQLGTSRYPAFTSLVKQQLQRDYDSDDLRSEGLVIFTTLDTSTQAISERALAKHLDKLDPELGKQELQGAVVTADIHTGEVTSLVGGRNARYVGFNRALTARRQVGSLIKPFIYLAGLQEPNKYTLATLLDDSELSIPQRGRAPWKPKNYTGRFVGPVPLYKALAKSYNIPAIRVGMDVGAAAVNNVLDALTVPVAADEKPIARLRDDRPATFLGTSEMSPYQVAQMYNGLASGGFVTPLNAIREVLTSDDQPLERYPLKIDQGMNADAVYLINAALKKVAEEGSASSTRRTLRNITVAGKTGTTNDTRDAWFAGFSANKLGVVWVGRDDNKRTRLTGSSGALPVWTSIMKEIAEVSYEGALPENIEQVTIDPQSGLRWAEGCNQSVSLPFLYGSAPVDYAPCANFLRYPEPVYEPVDQNTNTDQDRGNFIERLFDF